MRIILAKIGYARVSSVGQNLEVQLDKLKDCDKIFEEKESGTNYQRPRLQACLEYVREDDILIVSRLDRLARSTLHLCQIAEILDSKKVVLRVLDQNIDTSDATGRLLFNMLGAIAQFETELRAERQADGIAKARAKGIKLGGIHKLKDKEILELQQLRASGVLIKDLCFKYRISKASVYRYLKKDVSKKGCDFENSLVSQNCVE